MNFHHFYEILNNAAAAGGDIVKSSSSEAFDITQEAFVAPEEIEEDQQLQLLSNQMQIMTEKLINLISRMKNKNKGYALLRQISMAIQNATGATDSNIKNAALGNLPSQRNKNLPTSQEVPQK